MQVRQAIRSRRMIRRFDPDRSVPDHVLTEVLDHAQRAPSAGFSQGWDFVVLRDPHDRAAYWNACEGPDSEANRPMDAWLAGVSSAPVLVVCCSNPSAYLERYAEPDKGWTDRDPGRWPIPYWDVDVGMAVMAMLLTAVEHHVGALFFGVPGPRHDQVRAALAIPAGRRLVGVVALGYPLGDPRTHPRSPSLARGRRTGVVHYGRFGTGGG